MIRRRDQRSMKTPTNGPITENGTITIAEAIAKLAAVVARSGENTSEATSAAWIRPSADWLTSRIANRRRKSAWRSASRGLPMRAGAGTLIEAPS